MNASVAGTKRVDASDLEQKVKAMYRAVALEPHGEFHFEMGRGLAERLGYPGSHLDRIPGEAIDSFAGVGYYFDLAADKDAVFREAARLLKPGGRLALADIVTGLPLPESITCDATLWAACIGGAMQLESYLCAIQAAGLTVRQVKDNPQYRFVSNNAQGATRKFDVKSISLVAVKE